MSPDTASLYLFSLWLWKRAEEKQALMLLYAARTLSSIEGSSGAIQLRQQGRSRRAPALHSQLCGSRTPDSPCAPVDSPLSLALNCCCRGREAQQEGQEGGAACCRRRRQAGGGRRGGGRAHACGRRRVEQAAGGGAGAAGGERGRAQEGEHIFAVSKQLFFLS